MKSRSITIRAPELVGQALLKGDADVGLQQMSELLAVPGIQVVGPLPDIVQRVNVIAAAIATNSKEPQAAASWIEYLQTPFVKARFADAGFDPMTIE